MARILRSRRRPASLITAAVLVSAPLAATITPATPAAATTAGLPDHARQAAEPAGLTAERQQIVNRAVQALTTPKRFKLKNSPKEYKSQPGWLGPGRPDKDTNYLGLNGSNDNRNEYNGFAAKPTHRQWCGFFAGAMWPRHSRPSDVGSARAWRDDLGKRWHPYSPSRPPQPGDVLMWANMQARTGHVGVVVAVDGDKVTTIEGNTGWKNDSISREHYTWTGNGPVLRGKSSKPFQGFASPS
ncbi:CHAP domain-containing protein [Streptomyces netropsis]|uniref:CHAP domain-containing protein n=1 Tax=Streptomyces netropsis TaxID=55404 RepID=UPI003796B713